MPRSFINNKISPVPRSEGTLAMVSEQVTIDVCGLEILAYLPAKKVQSLESVCKDWLQLIRSSYFVRLHLWRGNGRRIRVLVSQLNQPIMIEYNNYYQQTKTNRRVAFPPVFSGSRRVLGPADGLIFMQGVVLGVFEPGVFNPSTGKYCVLQLCPRGSAYPCFQCSWFGNLTDGEYALVLVFTFDFKQHEIWVYKFTPGSNILNRICSTQITEVRIYEGLQNYGTLAQGVVHWPVDTDYYERSPNRYKILAYDLGNNKHRMILPPVLCDFRLGLFVDGCSLMATSMKHPDPVVEFWIMKGDCWTKYANIVVSNDVFSSISPLGIFPNGDLIMDVNMSRLMRMRYSFKHEEATLLMEYGTFVNGVTMCHDTLVSPCC